MEKLIIRKFGPIENIDLNLGSFNIIIGENASGKSTIAKVLAVCRYFSYIINKNGENPSYSFSDGLEAWGLKEYIKSESYIYYENEDYSLKAYYTNLKEPIFFNDAEGELHYQENEVPVFSANVSPKSKEFQKLINEYNDIFKSENNDTSLKRYILPVNFFTNNVSKVMNNPFYLPTERGLQSVFSLGRHSIQNLSDSTFNQFARINSISTFFANGTNIDPLDIEYKNEGGKGYIKKNKDDDFFSLANAASGYQSTTPIVLVVKYYSEILKKEKTIIIEEPELNLFPNAQCKLMEYLVYKCINSIDSQIFITTHSPYVLKTINNLVYAYWVGQMHSQEVKNIIDEKYWLNPDLLSVYKLTNKGESINILDSSKQINIEELDAISEIVSKKWDEIKKIHDGKYGY